MYEQYDQKLTLEPSTEKDWEKLADFKCPLCGLDLLTGKYHRYCTCGFKINHDKLAQLQSEHQQRRLNSRERKMLAEGKRIRFKETKTFKGERPDKLNLGF